MDAETNNIPPKENEREVFQWGGRSLHTTRRTAHILVEVVFNLICMIFVVDLIACRLYFCMSAVACS
jgi:hypothetical protein